MTIKIEWIDDYVLRTIADRICNEDALKEIVGEENVGSAEALAQAASIRADIESMRAMAMAREMSPQDFKEYKARWLPEAERLEAEAAAAESRPGVGIALELLEIAKSSGLEGSELEALVLRAIKKRVPLHGQRELVRTLTRSITVHPATVWNGYQFDEDRIKVE